MAQMALPKLMTCNGEGDGGKSARQAAIWSCSHDRSWSQTHLSHWGKEAGESVGWGWCVHICFCDSCMSRPGLSLSPRLQSDSSQFADCIAMETALIRSQTDSNPQVSVGRG